MKPDAPVIAMVIKLDYLKSVQWLPRVSSVVWPESAPAVTNDPERGQIKT